MKKPKVSEIRARDQSAPGGARFDVPYLLDLVQRLGKALEQEMPFYENDNPETLEARALLLEIKE